jgi:hypothetical protein
MLDFSEAQAKIKEDENRRRIEEGLTTGLTKEVSEAFRVDGVDRSSVLKILF